MEHPELEIRVATVDDWDAISRLMFTVFHDTYDDEEAAVSRPVYEPERGLVATDAGEVVGHAAAYSRDMTVPGAVLPVAHVTMVGVAPTHRRRGLLSRMMRRQLREAYDAGREPLAALWASEGRIYQRFGYGLGATKLGLKINSRELGLARPAAPAGRLRTGQPAAVATELAKVYDAVWADRPGWSGRDDRWWDHRLVDLASHRRGATERRAVLHDGQSGVDGYALFRVKQRYDEDGPQSEVIVTEVVAGNPAAYAALWRFLLSLDLTRSTQFWAAATDEALLYLAGEVRALGARLTDALWTRVVDVGAALSARRYAAPVDVVVDVTDELLPENAGRWRLVADASGAAECTRTEAAADLACDVSVLGAAYLGGSSFGALAAAGRVTEHRAGAVAAASTAFGWHRAPSSFEAF